MKIDTKTTDYKSSIRKEVDRILNKREEADRIRDAFNLWLKVNPKIEVSYSDGSKAWVTAKVAYKQTMEKVRFLKEQHENDLGITNARKNSAGVGGMGWRGLLEFPPGSIEFMRMFAVGLFRDDAQQQKKAAKSLSRIFPELTVPRKV